MAELKDEFCNYEQAQALEKLGFDWECFGYWENKILIFRFNTDKTFVGVIVEYYEKEAVLAPTLHQAFRFMRERYGLNSIINKSGFTDDYFWGIEYEHGFNGISVNHTKAEYACLDRMIEISQTHSRVNGEKE